jgi:hypothetical protein
MNEFFYVLIAEQARFALLAWGHCQSALNESKRLTQEMKSLSSKPPQDGSEIKEFFAGRVSLQPNSVDLAI